MRRTNRIIERSFVRGKSLLDDAGPIVGLASSRIGRDVNHHRRVCQFLTRSLLDCRDAGGTLLVARGTAIYPWAVRAASLFGTPIIELSVEADDTDAEIVLDSSNVTRDAAVIMLADRVDAFYVRRGGTIDRCLRDRLNCFQDASTRVAITGDRSCAAAELIAVGAIGWYMTTDKTSHFDGPLTHKPGEAWTRTDGQWLIHCTRAPGGPWPGESIDQYRDSMLVDHPDATDRAPVDALESIVRSRRLIASSVATTRTEPVVCFSALPLDQILDKRCFRPHLCRWDYEPFGVAIATSAARMIGARPVIYGEPDRRKTLPANQRYLFHPIGKTFDWRSEREWRCRGSVDLNTLNVDEVRVFAKAAPAERQALDSCPWRVTWLS